MKRPSYRMITMIGLCGALLIGCSSNENMDTNTSTVPSEETQSSSYINSESSSATSEESSNSESGESTESSLIPEESSSDSSSNEEPISTELQMDKEKILLPTFSPETVTENIKTNEKNTYTVSYINNQGEILDEVSGTRYGSPEAAEGDLTVGLPNRFFETADVPEGGEDLMSGITGYDIEKGDQKWLIWEDEEWVFNIHSFAGEQLSKRVEARDMITFLYDNPLPVPRSKGIVYLDYEPGGEDVVMVIHWQDEEMVYQVKTTRSSLEALEVTASLKQPSE